MPYASLRHALLTLTCLLAATEAIRAEHVSLNQPDTPPACQSKAPTFTRDTFQTPIDATKQFTMQVYLMNSAIPDNPNLTLLYYAEQGGKYYFNPTLVVPQGGTMDFVLQNCLNADGKTYIANLLGKDAAAPPPATPGAFNVIQAPQPMPSAYINLHTHGLGDKPVPSSAGDPSTPSGDEVLLTFLAPNIPLGTDVTYTPVANYQHYQITVPGTGDCSPLKPVVYKCQDVGTYWYHPHLHGEAQPQVFLGLTGAVVVIQQSQTFQSYEASGLFVIRDYPSIVPNPPPVSTSTADRTSSSKSSIMPMSTGQIPQVLHTRDLIYQNSAKASGTSFPTPGAMPQSLSHSKAATAGLGNRGSVQPSVSAALNIADKAQSAQDTEIPRCKLFLIAPHIESDLPDPCLPDQVKDAQASTTPASLTTLVTVNGVATETQHFDWSGTRPVQGLSFTPIPEIVHGTIRVLNASANTYLRIALHKGPPVTKTAPPSPPYSPNPDPNLGIAVALNVTNRDGHPIGKTTPDAQKTTSILLPPGSRVEFTPASPPTGDLNLVSEQVDTGPAGDLVPFRTLAVLSFPVRTPELSTASTNKKDIDNKDSQRYVSVTRDMASVESPTLGSQVAHPRKINKRAFAFYEQARYCVPYATNCGQSFYLIDITNSVYGDPNDHLKKSAVVTATPFMMPMHSDGTPTRELFGIDGKTFSPDIPSVQVALHSSTEEVDEDWDIYNFTAENHAFHVHQLGFYIHDSCSPIFLNEKKISPDCSKAKLHQGDENQESGLLLDVINVPPAYASGIPTTLDPTDYTLYPSKVSIRVPFNQSIVGNFVLHCHLLEHEDNGMMMGIQVWPGEIPDPATPPPASTNAAPGTSHTYSATTSVSGIAMK